MSTQGLIAATHTDFERFLMSTLQGRRATALLVIDAQTGVLANCLDRDAVIGRIAELVDRARAASVPVIWVQQGGDEFPEGTPRWQIADGLDPADDEMRIQKDYPDSFEDTALEAELAKRKVGRLVVCGAQTDACIRCTTHGAFARGYDVTLVGDAHTTEDIREWGCPIEPAESIAYLNLAWKFTQAPGREATVTESAGVTFA